MARLTGQDVSNLLESIRQIYALQDNKDFPNHIISILSKIIPSQMIDFCDVDNIKRLGFYVIDPPEILTPENASLFEKYVHEHPLFNVIHPLQSNPFRHHFGSKMQPFLDKIVKARKKLGFSSYQSVEGKVIKRSDILTEAEFQQTSLYNELFKKLGFETQMGILIINRWHRTVGFGLKRNKRDFSERERQILNMLGPHLIQAYRNMEETGPSKGLLSYPQKSDEEPDFGIIIMSKDGNILFCSKKAERQLIEYNSFQKGSLLETLRRWVRYNQSFLSQERGILEPRRPLVVENENKRLMFRITEDCLNCQYLLLLKEEPKLCREKSFEFLGLTPREVEILYWLSQGKTNTEIGLILCSNFRTVKKHLEHIYKKLGVENRTCASIRALEIFSNHK